MPSTQPSQSAPSGDRHADSESENVQSPGLPRAAQWHTIRQQQPQDRDQFPGASYEVGDVTLQRPPSATNLIPAVATGEIGQDLDHTAATHSSGGSDRDSPWRKKTLLTLGM